MFVYSLVTFPFYFAIIIYLYTGTSFFISLSFFPYLISLYIIICLSAVLLS